MTLMDDHIKHIHCMGIGGIGVSGLAELLLHQGYHISGSDIIANKNTLRLQRLGANIFCGHDAQHLQGADLTVYSSAISSQNPEFIAAQSTRIPMYCRGRMLAELMNNYSPIAVAGTHGKTTTSGLVTHLLSCANLDPTAVIGGMLNTGDSPVLCGNGDYFVAEADESDASFLYMKPRYAIVTNIDQDHLETYQGNFSTLTQSFCQFIDKIPSNGAAILCCDDPTIKQLIRHCQPPYLTYGFCAEAQYRLYDYHQQGLVSKFKVKRPDGRPPLNVTLNIPGQHNALNATAAITLADQLGVTDEVILAALRVFPGMRRRFHQRGELTLTGGKATIIEDYGHHPNEIKATLAAARLAWPKRRVVLVFQPHRYSRTQALMAEFIKVLANVDKLILLDIYPAGENPIQGVTSQVLWQALTHDAKQAPVYLPIIEGLSDALQHECQHDDVVILQGAGNIGTYAEFLTKQPQ